MSFKNTPAAEQVVSEAASDPVIALAQPAPKPLCHSVAECMDEYFKTLNGHAPKTLNLYDTVLEQVEPPLLRATLDYCEGNQSRAAELLGLNRATLRKKLMQYNISAR
ncbi:helix-turn-helix domain-containing protein [Nevskia sp.]|uniref:helix-turn-helix domain-containing protein n=1 Tax=Nevskia sp. TaxID=1929292 RepID=UPI0025E4DB04|nr:helix-turn-helix domain-containing protein [Nevskia sp.]HET7798136.1 helix-turn-helix domain-containing protein [Nevskia sp.]